MVRREIQPKRDRRAKCADRLQLERADLDREHVVFNFLARDFGEWFTDIAAGNRLLPALVEHLGQHLGICRLAVGPGNRNDWRFAGTPAKFELADDLGIARPKISAER